MKSEINIDALTPQMLDELKYSIQLMDMYHCPKCNYIFNKEDNVWIRKEKGTNYVYDGFDNYHEEDWENDIEQIKCPNCGFKDDEEEFPFAYTDDIADAPNSEELVPGITDYLNQIDNN